MPSSVQIRLATPEDAEACGRICYEAFATINRHHGFPPDIPASEVGVRLLGMLLAHPGIYCVVAESNGRILGSNCLDERSTIAGVGPITIEPNAQNQSIGRMLMEAVLNRARARLSGSATAPGCISQPLAFAIYETRLRRARTDINNARTSDQEAHQGLRSAPRGRNGYRDCGSRM